MVKEFKVEKFRVVMIYRDSRDEKVRVAGITTRSVCKGGADISASQTESTLGLEDITGNLCKV